MVCEDLGGVIVCGPPRGVYKRQESARCGECRADHRFVVQWDGAWYGSTSYGECGDTWMDGERLERPFQRGWRKRAQAEFEEKWNHAATDQQYNAYRDADCDLAFAHTEAEINSAIERRNAAHDAILAARKAD